MNESIPNSGTEELQQGINPCYIPTEIELAQKLRAMLENVSDPDIRCTLCKSAEQLEKSQSKSWDSSLLVMVLMIMLMSNISTSSQVDPNLVNAFLNMNQKEAAANEHTTGQVPSDRFQMG